VIIGFDLNVHSVLLLYGIGVIVVWNCEPNDNGKKQKCNFVGERTG